MSIITVERWDFQDLCALIKSSSQKSSHYTNIYEGRSLGMPPADEKTGRKEGFSVFTELGDSAKVIADIDITQGKGCRSLTVPANALFNQWNAILLPLLFPGSRIYVLNESMKL